MAGVNIGSATFTIDADNTQLVASLIQAQAKAQQASQAIQAAVAAQTTAIQSGSQAAATASAAQARATQGAIQAAQQAQQRFQQLAQASQQSSSSFMDLAKAGVALGAGLAGISLGLATVREGMAAVYDATVKAGNAQFALNAAYGDGAAALEKFAAAQAKSTEFSKTNIEQGLAITSALAKEGNFSEQQQEELLKRAEDLAAAYGTDLPEALKALENAFKGRSGALTQFGVLINQEVIKELGGLSEAEKKHIDQLPESIRLQAGYNAVMALTADRAGDAENHLNTLGGAQRNLESRTTELSAALGKLLAPSLAAVSNETAKAESGLTSYIDSLRITAQAQKELKDEGVPGFSHTAADLAVDAEQAKAALEARVKAIQQREAAAGPGPVLGPDPADVAALIQAEKDRQAAIAEIRKQARKDEAEAGLRSAEDAHRADVKALDDQKTVLEAEREAKLRAVDAEKQATLDGIRDQAQAAKAASEAELNRLRDDEAAKKKTVEDEKQATLDRLAVERQASADASAEQIRQDEIARDAALKGIETQKQAELDALDATKRARDDARVVEDRQLQDAATAEQRFNEQAHEANTRLFDDETRAVQSHKSERLRAIDDESKHASDAHDKRMRALEDEGRKQDEQHQKRLQAISDEAKKQTDAIDAQIKALDDAQKASENSSRIADLQKGVTDAQAALTQANGTGTPEQVTGARRDLTQALRISGNDVGIANARDRLNQLAGQGIEAVKKASADLAAAQKALTDEQTKETQDAAKAQLQAQKDGIAEQADAEKRAEDARDQRRKDRLTKDKQAADDTLKKSKDSIDQQKRAVDDQEKHDLAAIDERKRADQDLYRTAVNDARDAAEQAKRAVDDRRRTENEADQDRRTQIERTAKASADAVHAQYDDEATGVIPAIRRAQHAAEEGYAAQTKAAEDTARAQIAAIDDTYTNHEHGLIPLAEAAAAAVAQGFQDQAHAVEESAAAQKQSIQDVYSNAGKTGLIDLIEQARADSEAKLQAQRDYWSGWAEDIGGKDGQIAKVIDKFDELIKKIQSVGATVTVGGNVTEPSFRGDASDDSSGGGPGPNVGAGSDQVPAPYSVSFPFGARYSNPFNSEIPIHRGVDVVVKGAANGGEGSAVEAFEDGQVVYDSYDPNGGNGIIIRGADGLYHRYFHFDSTDVSVGQEIHRGDVIGTLGQSGTEGSPHLHYEVSKHVNGDPIGDLIDPVPYMSKGGARTNERATGGRTFTFSLFGQTFTVHLPGGAGGSELINAIERIGERIGGREFGHAAASIALSEGADGDLSQPGAGGARGPYQFDPSGELPNYAAYLHKSVNEAGDYAGSHPLDAATWALRGYLGDALRDGLDQGLKGADLADYGSLVGQRPEGENYLRAGDASRRLWGYRYGGWISPNSMIVDAAGSPYARTEDFPERVLSPEQSAAWAAGDSSGMVIHEGDVVFQGVGLPEVAGTIQRQQQARRILRGGSRWRG